jgi:hypothetical protein
MKLQCEVEISVTRLFLFLSLHFLPNIQNGKKIFKTNSPGHRCNVYYNTEVLLKVRRLERFKGLCNDIIMGCAIRMCGSDDFHIAFAIKIKI